MGRLFNDLSYANDVTTHIGAPLEAVDNTLGVLEQKYNANRDAADKLSIALANLEVNPANQHIKNDAEARLKSTFQTVVEKGDWENAADYVRVATKDFATDSGLLYAIKDKQAMDKQKAELQARVGLPEDKGGILQEDYDVEVARAEARYKQQNNGMGGVYKDEATGSWKGQWTIAQPPGYIDIGKKADEFLEKAKPDTVIGDNIKGKDGKWYKAKFVTTPDGGYWTSTSTEALPFQEVYAMAKNYISQDNKSMERIRYDVGKADTKNYQWYADHGITREGMIDDLVKLGVGNVDKYSSYSDEEVADAYKSEMVMYDKLSGAVLKNSYTKETLQTIGETMEARMAIERMRNAKKSGGDEKTVEHFNYIEQAHTGAYKHDIPDNVDMYITLRETTHSELTKHRQSLDGFRQELEKDPLWADFKAGKVDAETFAREVKNKQAYKNYVDTRATISSLENQETLHNNLYARAVTKTLETVKANDPTLPARVKEYYAIKNDPQMAKLFKTMKDVPPSQRQDALRTFPKEQVEKWRKADAMRQDLFSAFGSEDKFSAKVSENLKEYYDNNVVDYNYAILDDDGFGKPSYFTERVTQRLKESADSFYLVNSDGRSQEFSLKSTGKMINLANSKAVGYTSSPVGKHGYGIVVREMQYDDDDKDRKNPIGFKEHIVIPKDDPAFYRNLAIDQVRRGYKLNKGSLDDGYDLNNPSALESIWNEDAIDRQMVDFDIFPSETREGGVMVTELPISVGGTYNFKVARMIYPNGVTSWQVQGTDGSGKAIKGSNGETVVTYGNKYDVEFALESLAGTGRKVPLSALDPVDNNTFEHINLNKQVETPYLHKDFIEELKSLDGSIPVDLEISGMTRSYGKNREVSGVENSRHLLGLGADFSATPEAVKYFRDKYDIKGEETVAIPDSNLRVKIHDAGTGQHIHIETTKTPESISKFIQFKTN